MNTRMILAALALSLASIAPVLAQQAGQVQSLRGAAADQPVTIDDVFHQQEGRFVRNYRQQPPLIPHTIEKYQIDLKANECLSCHDWTNAGDRKAPTLSMTHYQDRNGNQLDRVAGTRWFCNQCHVPQVDAPALVDNTFAPSAKN